MARTNKAPVKEEAEETYSEPAESGSDIIELSQDIADTPEPVLMPPGWYLAQIESVEIRPNQAGTGRYYSTVFRVPTEKFPADYEVDNYPDGLPLYYNLVRVPRDGDRKSISNLRKFLEQIGMPTNISTIDPNEWIGRTAKVKVVHHTYQGQTREQIAPGGIQSAD
jgi:hypothetical protein